MAWEMLSPSRELRAPLASFRPSQRRFELNAEASKCLDGVSYVICYINRELKRVALAKLKSPELGCVSVQRRVRHRRVIIVNRRFNEALLECGVKEGDHLVLSSDNEQEVIFSYAT